MGDLLSGAGVWHGLTQDLGLIIVLFLLFFFIVLFLNYTPSQAPGPFRELPIMSRLETGRY